MKPTFGQQVFRLVMQNRTIIIRGFQLCYVLLGIIVLVGVYAEAIGHSTTTFFYELGLHCGELALLLLIVTATPGMCRRFHLNFFWVNILMNFRRYLGISVFLLALSHSILVRFVLSGFLPLAVFEMFGLSALLCLFPMFLTSNDWSTHVLGPWWKRLHSLIYVILWLIFLHVGLQALSIWSVLIGITAFLEVVSLIFAWWEKL